jgi:hypothetical protein
MSPLTMIIKVLAYSALRSLPATFSLKNSTLATGFCTIFTDINNTMIVEEDNGTDRAEHRKLNVRNGELTDTLESKGRGLAEKRLSFSNDLTRTVEIPNLEEYSPDEKSRAWYTTDNVAGFKREARGKASLIRHYYPTIVNDVEESYAAAEGFPRDEDELFRTLQQLNLLPHSVSWSGFFS